MQGLDSDPIRGQDAQNYAAWTGEMYRQGFYRLDDIAAADDHLLVQMIGMNVGTARRVLRWAADDVAALRREAARGQNRRQRYL